MPIIEVTDTSLRYDREFKIPLYACHGIAEVSLVDLDNRSLQVHRKPAASGYPEHRILSDARPLTPVMLPEYSFYLTGLF